MDAFFGAVLGGCGVVARCSVSRGVVDWSISVVSLFDAARKISFGVASRDCVILGRLSCGCVDWGRIVLCRFSVVFDRGGGDISGSLGIASGNRIVFRKIGAISS
jgi:hypothetical protein